MQLSDYILYCSRCEYLLSCKNLIATDELFVKCSECKFEKTYCRFDIDNKIIITIPTLGERKRIFWINDKEILQQQYSNYFDKYDKVEDYAVK